MQTPYSAPYRDANIIQKSLFQRIISSDVQDKDKGLLARVWVEIEAFKREMRGIPRLSSHSLQDLAMARSSLAKRLSRSTPPTTPFTELDATEATPAGETPPQTDVPPQAT